MDMKISGSGTVGAGEYDNIRISGSGKLLGPIRAANFHCSGSAHCVGFLYLSGDMSVSGSSHIDGSVNARSIRVSGSSTVERKCTAEEIKISGSFRCGDIIKSNFLRISGSARTESIEAEDVSIDGKIICSGLLNAEKINIELDGSGSEIGSIGGSIIHIGKCSETTVKFLGFTISKNKHGELRVRDSIEGDEIELEHVSADSVIGRVVKIGEGCKIKTVQYSESIEIDPKAQVKEQIKI